MSRPKLQPRLFLLVAVLGLSLVLAGPGQARAEKKEVGEEGAWRLQAEELRSEEDGQVAEAHGRVVFGNAQEKITCEHLRYDRRLKSVEAWGDVSWHHGGDSLQADRLKLDLETKMGKAFNARVFVSSSHFYMSGREIEKTGEKTYVIKDCTVTTCDGLSPDWVVRATTLNVTVDGYGHLWNPRFYAGKVPIFYFPYASFPVKSKRESGFLAPVLITSSRDGFAFELPYYWAWADWGETTFFLHQSAARGQGLGVELNFMLGQRRDRGLFYFDYLHDKEAEIMFKNGENSTDTKDRYWLRGILRADKLLPWGIGLNLTLDYPSDPDFIREFDYWETGLPNLNRRFRDFFGQSLPDETDDTRLNRLLLGKSWSNQRANLEFRYQYDPNPGETDDLIQNLPRLSYSYSDKPIGRSNVYYSFDASARNVYREEGDRGQELDGNASIYYLTNLGPYLQVQPRLNGRGTLWRVDPNDPEADDFDEYRSRFSWSGQVDLSTAIFKIYDLDGVNWKKIKHLITPRLTFRYAPELKDDPAPSFAGTVGAVEKLEGRLISTLTVKKAQGVDNLNKLKEEIWRRRYLGILSNWSVESDNWAGTTDEELWEEYQRRLRLHQLDRAPKFGYEEFLRLELRQSYDIRHARLGGKEPFSNLNADLTFEPSRFFRIRAQAEYNPYEQEFPRVAVYNDLLDKRGDYFGLQWRRRFNEDSLVVDLHQIRADLRLKLVGPWTAGGQFIYDLANKKTISETVSLSFQRQCWGIAASYYHSSDDSRIALVFSLFGLGEIYRYERAVGNQG